MGKQTLQIECDPEPDEIRPGMFRKLVGASVKKIFFRRSKTDFLFSPAIRLTKQQDYKKDGSIAMNEENKNSASGEMTGVRDAGAIARDIKKLLSAKLQKMSSGSRSGRRSAWSDFCNFRIMLFPQIIKILWFLGMIVSTLGGLFLIIGGISRGAWGSAGLGLLVLLFSLSPCLFSS